MARMDKNLYQKRLNHVEEVLAPLLRAKYKNWEPQYIVDILAGIFTLAETNSWQRESSKALISNQPFFKYYRHRIGQTIWSLTRDLSTGPWTELRYNKLDFKGWPKPEVPSSNLPQKKVQLGIPIISGEISPLDYITITRAERLKSRKIWNSLYRDVSLLNKKPGAEIYEYPPYCTHVFRFEKSLFRDHIWQASVHHISHSEFCEYILRPVYFSAMYEVRALVPYRVSKSQVGKAEQENSRIKILPLISICRNCLRPIKNNIKGRKGRSDRTFCKGNTCKNSYHRTRKTRSNNS